MGEIHTYFIWVLKSGSAITSNDLGTKVNLAKLTSRRSKIFLTSSSIKSASGAESTNETFDDKNLICPVCTFEVPFKDEKLYPAGPRCKVGDVILMAPYAGQRILVGTDVQAEEYRIIPDAVVSAIVPKPGLVRRNM